MANDPNMQEILDYAAKAQSDRGKDVNRGKDMSQRVVDMFKGKSPAIMNMPPPSVTPRVQPPGTKNLFTGEEDPIVAHWRSRFIGAPGKIAAGNMIAARAVLNDEGIKTFGSLGNVFDPRDMKPEETYLMLKYLRPEYLRDYLMKSKGLSYDEAEKTVAEVLQEFSKGQESTP